MAIACDFRPDSPASRRPPSPALAIREDGLAGPAGRQRLAGPTRPSDAGEVDDPAAAVDRPPAAAGDQALPGAPAAALDERQLDRGAPSPQRHGIGVEQADQLAGRRRHPPIAARGEAEVGAGLEHDRVRGELASGPCGGVGGGVVDDDQLVARPQLVDERGQRRGERPARIVGDDHGREGGHGDGILMQDGGPAVLD